MHITLQLAIVYLLLFLVGCTTVGEKSTDETSTSKLAATNIDYIKYRFYIYNSGCWISKDNKEMTTSEFNNFFSECGKDFVVITNDNVHKFHNALEQCSSNHGFSFRSCK